MLDAYGSIPFPRAPSTFLPKLTHYSFPAILSYTTPYLHICFTSNALSSTDRLLIPNIYWFHQITWPYAFRFYSCIWTEPTMSHYSGTKMNKFFLLHLSTLRFSLKKKMDNKTWSNRGVPDRNQEFIVLVMTIEVPKCD